jgi:flavin reductase (DIM6/NTAB) family NADH-FMN oxidoreductase RutF
VTENRPNLDEIESVLRLVDREVWIITASNGARRGGLTATWVLPASVDRQRPMLVAGIATNHFTAELIDAQRAFAAHLLRADQLELAWNFARDSGRDRDKLSGLRLITLETGSPILADCLACCDCRVVSRYDTGDRVLYWADVATARQIGTGPPLREQQFFRSLPDEQRQTLLAARDADVMIQRPLHVAWRDSQASLP